MRLKLKKQTVLKACNGEYPRFTSSDSAKFALSLYPYIIQSSFPISNSDSLQNAFVTYLDKVRKEGSFEYGRFTLLCYVLSAVICEAKLTLCNTHKTANDTIPDSRQACAALQARPSQDSVLVHGKRTDFVQLPSESLKGEEKPDGALESQQINNQVESQLGKPIEIIDWHPINELFEKDDDMHKFVHVDEHLQRSLEVVQEKNRHIHDSAIFSDDQESYKVECNSKPLIEVIHGQNTFLCTEQVCANSKCYSCTVLQERGRNSHIHNSATFSDEQHIYKAECTSEPLIEVIHGQNTSLCTEQLCANLKCFSGNVPQERCEFSHREEQFADPKMVASICDSTTSHATQKSVANEPRQVISQAYQKSRGTSTSQTSNLLGSASQQSKYLKETKCPPSTPRPGTPTHSFHNRHAPSSSSTIRRSNPTSTLPHNNVPNVVSARKESSRILANNIQPKQLFTSPRSTPQDQGNSRPPNFLPTKVHQQRPVDCEGTKKMQKQPSATPQDRICLDVPFNTRAEVFRAQGHPTHHYVKDRVKITCAQSGTKVLLKVPDHGKYRDFFTIKPHYPFELVLSPKR